MIKKTIDIISIFIAIGFSILGIIAYTGYFNPVYDFVGWSVAGPIIAEDPNFPLGYQTIHFVSTAMSAQNPIKVIITIELDEKLSLKILRKNI